MGQNKESLRNERDNLRQKLSNVKFCIHEDGPIIIDENLANKQIKESLILKVSEYANTEEFSRKIIEMREFIKRGDSSEIFGSNGENFPIKSYMNLYDLIFPNYEKVFECLKGRGSVICIRDSWIRISDYIRAKGYEGLNIESQNHITTQFSEMGC